MPLDCIDLGTMANQIKSFHFCWSKLTKETWIWPKRNMQYVCFAKFRLAIDKAPESVPPAGSRHLRPIERAQRVLVVLAPITNASDKYGPGNIIKDYLVDEEIWAKEIEMMKIERQKASEESVQETTSKMEADEGRMSTMCRIL